MDLGKLDKYLNDCIKKKKIPGLVLWVGNDKMVFYFESFGYQQLIPEKIKMERETVFDLASITKPLCTAMATMLLAQEKEIKLDDKIEKYMPEFKRKRNGTKTIKELLTHTSGLPAWYPLYLLSYEERWDFLARESSGRTGVIYSCLGYIILCRIVERIVKRRLDSFCAERIFKGLNLNNTRFGPIEKENVAPTELGNRYEKKLASKYGDVSKVVWRKYLIKGRVHDGNSYYAFNGISGNAGLFSNAPELARIIRSYLKGRIVNMDSVQMMIKDWTGGIEKRSLGWWVNPYPEFLSAQAFGHTGFTGTMVMVEPKKNLIIILLSNSVHPRVKLGVMPKIRKEVIKIISGD